MTETLKRFIKLHDGQQIFHGDEVRAMLKPEENDMYRVEVVGKLCINSDGYLYICQNARSGADAANETFGYNYSWNFRLEDDGRIASPDTDWIKKVEKENVVEEDDDPMPEDWVCEEKVPYNL